MQKEQTLTEGPFTLKIVHGVQVGYVLKVQGTEFYETEIEQLQSHFADLIESLIALRNQLEEASKNEG